MGLKFKYIPLTFLTDEEQIKYQIKNTIILRYLFDKYEKTCRLENLIVNTQYGYNASALKNGKNKFLRISDITDGKVDWESVPFCDCKDEDTYLLKTEDLLVARTGGTTGKSFMISNPPVNSVFAGYLIRMRANEQNNPEFINLFLNSYIYWSQVVSLNKGEFRPSVNATKLKNLILPDVDISIQNEAVRISNSEQIESYKELYNLIELTLSEYSKSKIIIDEVHNQFQYSDDLKQAILQEAIQGKLTEEWRAQNPNTESASELLERIKAEKEELIKGKKLKKEKPLPAITEDEIPFEIPESWVWCRLGEISKYIQRGKSPKYVEHSNVPVISQKCVQWGRFDFNKARFINENTLDKYTEERFLQNGDLLWNSTGDGTVGRLIEFKNVTNYSKMVVDSHVAIVRLLVVKPSYILYYLSTKLVQDKLIVSGSTKQTELSKTTIVNHLVPIPPLEEQKAIVEKVQALLQKCNALEQEVTQSEQHANMLMQAVLKEAFESKNEKEDDIIKELLPDKDKYAQVAIATLKTELLLNRNYGKVEKQKTGFLLKAIKKQPIPYAFENYNYGTFSKELSNDLDHNPYLFKTHSGEGEVYKIKPDKHKEIVALLNQPEHADFVNAIEDIIRVYKMPLIKGKTEQIELLNTVCKSILDTQSTDLETIYGYMELWMINQDNHTTKAEKFTKNNTKKMLDLVLKLNWDKELIN
ncbi:restriction endonuclease subunit S [Aquimarina brevivitae]|uniref:Type I restriction modification DNA specificity protein n=1 Tax=Aquimarina brevivitae TaxID=323412 RepID=A0A4Q7P283_9FLAO|nr:restriction endonuclease subunit S [Aquimarina brevivitae]RZS93865.1 type I restriction modification DNA specificity protein [Aquimarina brevivitae]